MTDDRATRLERIAMLLDGQLTPDQRHEVEREIHASPEARAQFEALRRIDASLKGSFADAKAPSVLAPSALRATGSSTFRRVALGAIAAALLLLVTGWFLWPTGQWPKSGPRPTTVDGLLDKYIAGGFAPEFRCENDEQFIRFTTERLGVGLLASASPGVQLLGWGYPRDAAEMGLADGVVSLLCRVDGHEVLVLMNPAGRASEPKTQWVGGSNVFRRDVGGVLLIEVTPLDEARVLPLFQTVECPDPAADSPAPQTP